MKVIQKAVRIKEVSPEIKGSCPQKSCPCEVLTVPCPEFELENA